MEQHDGRAEHEHATVGDDLTPCGAPSTIVRQSSPRAIVVHIMPGCSERFRSAEDFVETVEHPCELLFGRPGEARADAIDRQRPNLTDPDPRSPGQPGRIAFERV